MKAKRSHRQDKLAKIYDAEILPIWTQRFGRLLLRDLTLPPKAMVLDVGCGTGYPALDVLRRMDDNSRMIAIDPSSAMLEVARAKAGPLSGKRIFFRTESPEPRLSFADDVYDLVIANLFLQDVEDPAAMVRELCRVTKPDGHVLATVPLVGTFSEFYDIFREVLIKLDRPPALDRLEQHLAEKPSPELARGWFEAAGMLDVTVDSDWFTLLFRSSREFFFAPLIEYGELREWKQVAGEGQEMQDVFWRIKEAIDAYFGDKSFELTVIAGCVRARKPTEEEARQRAALMPPPPPMGETGRAAPLALVPDNPWDDDDDELPEADEPTGQIEIGTSEIEVVEEYDDDHPSPDSLPFHDDDDEDDDPF